MKTQPYEAFINQRTLNKIYLSSPSCSPSDRHTNCPKEEMSCFWKIYCLQACKYTEFQETSVMNFSVCSIHIFFISLFFLKYSKFVKMDVHLILNFIIHSNKISLETIEIYENCTFNIILVLAKIKVIFKDCRNIEAPSHSFCHVPQAISHKRKESLLSFVSNRPFFFCFCFSILILYPKEKIIFLWKASQYFQYGMEKLWEA